MEPIFVGSSAVISEAIGVASRKSSATRRAGGILEFAKSETGRAPRSVVVM